MVKPAKVPKSPVLRNRRKFTQGVAVIALAFGMGLAVAAPDPPFPRMEGIYQVVASSDPLFPLQNQQEWFLDFGKGVTAGKLSGTVAVSLRKNPNVRVRLMAWQYFPRETALVMGNPYQEGSRQAVAAGTWQLRTSGKQLDLQRDGFRVILRRAANP